jgi:hypothetical protein
MATGGAVSTAALGGKTDNARFAKRLRKDRPHLLRFLYVDDLEPTNNLAERMLSQI